MNGRRETGLDRAEVRCVTRTTCEPSRGRVQAGLELSDLLPPSNASAHDIGVRVDVEKPLVREEGVGQVKLGQELLASIGRDGNNTENQVGGMVDLGLVVDPLLSFLFKGGWGRSVPVARQFSAQSHSTGLECVVERGVGLGVLARDDSTGLVLGDLAGLLERHVGDTAYGGRGQHDDWCWDSGARNMALLYCIGVGILPAYGIKSGINGSLAR